MRLKPASPIHSVNDNSRLVKDPDLPPTTPPAMAPTCDFLVDPEDGPGGVPDGVLVAAPVEGPVPVDSGAPACSTH
jgi:hypothetical protein